MVCCIMKMKSVLHARTTSEEAVTCIAVKEDRQHSMSIVALKKGVEEPWTIGRVATFIDLLGYREITLKSDREIAIIAFRNRFAEMCKAEVTTRTHQDSNGLIENAMMPSEPSSVTLRAARKSHSATNRLSCRGWWNMQDASCPDVKTVVTGRRHVKDCMARSRHKNLSQLVKKCW